MKNAKVKNINTNEVTTIYDLRVNYLFLMTEENITNNWESLKNEDYKNKSLNEAIQEEFKLVLSNYTRKEIIEQGWYEFEEIYSNYEVIE